MTTFFDLVATWWAYGLAHRESFIVGGLAVTVLVLVLRMVIRRAMRGGRPDKWLSVVSLMIGMGWSAEAMWEIATQQLHLATSFALLVFFVFETQLGVAMIRSERHQREHRNPGRYGRTAWLIALVMGCIAAMAGDTWVERALRLAVPLLVTKQWWDGLTGDGVTKPEDSITWTWTPRRILVALNLARPGQQDLSTADRRRQVFALAKVSHRLHSTRWGWRRAWCQMRLRRLSMQADDSMLDEARGHVERVWRSADRTRPIEAEDLAVIALARSEADAYRIEANEARAAHDAAVAWAETAAGLADTESAAARRLQAELAAVTAKHANEMEALRADSERLRRELASAREVVVHLEERARSAQHQLAEERREREAAQDQLVAELRARSAAVRRAQAPARQVRRSDRLSATPGGAERVGEDVGRMRRLAQVQEIIDKHPDSSTAEIDALIAAGLGCSDRTARRLRSELKAEQITSRPTDSDDGASEAGQTERPLASAAA